MAYDAQPGTPAYEAQRRSWEMEKANGSWGAYEDFDEYMRIKSGAGSRRKSIRTKNGARDASALTPERIHEIFLATCGFSREPNKKDRTPTAPCWHWGGTLTLPHNKPYFGQGIYAPGFLSTQSAVKYAFEYYRGDEYTEMHRAAGTRCFRFRSCETDCVNPWHQLIGQRSVARTM